MNDSKMGTEMHMHGHCGKFRTISWSAILVGAFVAMGLSFLLNLLSIAIGLTAFTTSPEGNFTLATSGFVGLVVGTFIVMFVAGMVAGGLARPFSPKCNKGELYGFMAWSVSLFLTIMIAAHIGDFLTRATSVIAPTVNSVSVSQTSNTAAPAVTATTTHHANKAATIDNIIVNPQKVVNNVGMAAFVTFFLFFIGALAASFGGRCGMTCCKKSDKVCCDTTQTHCH